MSSVCGVLASPRLMGRGWGERLGGCVQLEESDDETWGEDAAADSDSDDSQGEQDYPDTEEDNASTDDGACEHEHVCPVDTRGSACVYSCE